MNQPFIIDFSHSLVGYEKLMGLYEHIKEDISYGNISQGFLNLDLYNFSKNKDIQGFINVYLLVILTPFFKMINDNEIKESIFKLHSDFTFYLYNL